MRDRGRERSPPAPEPAGGPAPGSRPVGKRRPKDLDLGVSTAQVTGNPKGTSVGKEAAPPQVRPREPMSVLMMANREVVSTELGPYHESAEHEDCSQPMDDIQVSAGEGSPPRRWWGASPPPRPSRPMATSPVAGPVSRVRIRSAPSLPGSRVHPGSRRWEGPGQSSGRPGPSRATRPGPSGPTRDPAVGRLLLPWHPG